MDDLYRAKLTGSPPRTARGNHDLDQTPVTILPHRGPEGAAIPIQLPNIYVNPFPPPPSPTRPVSVSPPRHERTPAPLTSALRRPRGYWEKMGFGRPHPLTWLAVIISFAALVLGVPKGHLPTLTGRHKELRAQERLVAERINLLTQLSAFLPPPLSTIVSPDPSVPNNWGPFGDKTQLDLLRSGVGGMRFWNTELGGVLGVGLDGPERWWSIEDVGKGASVVRSKGDGRDREVWVLRTGEGEDSNAALVSSLTHSLLLRDRLQAELDQLRASPCPACPVHLAPAHHIHQQNGAPLLITGLVEDELDMDQRHVEWEKIEERKRRERERERDVEERERQVSRREKWVVEEMKKLSDRVHHEASELTLEDRITDRLKAYQRQLSQLREAEGEH
ncbi:hypothetical protein M231_02614 [Tremella mesenterica]|uniref:Uncharacterized protein n=1 Tax=Tremella mesenterica TaxID=5217 RepID=A0A4Q1BQF1_TREME|nr:uncharacterized protein TREMEDRAFT_61245 [Tremella mesenterica DSM 1558]EIW70733.1 hypothetical protein TREMEDRAFT_61245 [Tremella mesenterica DSM 1558]RXK40156.1 hypothetical protein M231_02614 [Tremella mesenterica]